MCCLLSKNVAGSAAPVKPSANIARKWSRWWIELQPGQGVVDVNLHHREPLQNPDRVVRFYGRRHQTGCFCFVFPRDKPSQSIPRGHLVPLRVAGRVTRQALPGTYTAAECTCRGLEALFARHPNRRQCHVPYGARRDSSINHRVAVPITDCKCAAARRRRVTIKSVRQWLLCRRGGVPPIRADHYWPSAMESCHRLMHEPSPPPSAHAAHRRDVRWRTMAGHLSRGACVSALIQFAMAGISHLQRNVRIPAQQSNLPTLGRAVPMQLPRSRQRRADAPSSVAAAVRKCMCTDWTPRCTCKHMGACCSGCAARR